MTTSRVHAWMAWRYDLEVPDAVAIACGCVVVFGLVVARLQALVKRVNSQSAKLSHQAERLHILARTTN